MAKEKMNLECNECGKKFKTSNPDTCCPNCGGVDLDVADCYFAAKAKKAVDAEFFNDVMHGLKTVYRNYSKGPFDFMPEVK